MLTHLHLPFLPARAARDSSAEPLEVIPLLHLPAGGRESPQGRDKIPISPFGADPSALRVPSGSALPSLFGVSVKPSSAPGSAGVWGAQTLILLQSQNYPTLLPLFGLFVPSWAVLCSQEGTVCQARGGSARGGVQKVLCLKI